MITQTIEILGTLLGLLYVYYQYKASPKLWITGLLMSVAFIFVFAKSACYFWAATYFYYFFADVYGLVLWKKNKKHTENQYVGIKRTPLKYYLPLLLIFIILSIPIGYISKYTLESPIPMGEAISTALSIVAMWLLAKKYLEHWLLWIIVNLFYAILNFSIELYPTALMFTVYLIVAIMGYWKWRKEMKLLSKTDNAF